jgi:hypothetical protein
MPPVRSPQTYGRAVTIVYTRKFPEKHAGRAVVFVDSATDPRTRVVSSDQVIIAIKITPAMNANIVTGGLAR